MIQEKLDDLIKSSLKNHDAVVLDVARAVKTAFMEHRTAKNAVPIDDAVELNIVRKMVKERIESAEIYAKAGRTDLTNKELAEASALERLFIPPEPSREDIMKVATEIVVEKEIKNMGRYIKELKSKFPSASGQTISEIVKSLISQ